MPELLYVGDVINTEERNVIVYVAQSHERLLKAAWKRNIVDEGETVKEFRREEEGENG